jgi:hypothetical protein
MTPTRAPGDTTPTATLAAVAVIGGLCALAWCGVQLAALLGSGRLLSVGLAELVRAVAALPGHAARPALAWPQPFRGQLPGPAVYWVAQTAPLAAVAWIVIAVTRRRRRSSRGHPLRVRADAGLA